MKGGKEMILFYRQYKNSKAATLLDMFGSLMAVGGILLAITTAYEELQSLESIVWSDFFAMLMVGAFFILAGIGLKKAERKVAEKKARK